MTPNFLPALQAVSWHLQSHAIFIPFKVHSSAELKTFQSLSLLCGNMNGISSHAFKKGVYFLKVSRRLLQFSKALHFLRLKLEKYFKSSPSIVIHVFKDIFLSIPLFEAWLYEPFSFKSCNSTSGVTQKPTHDKIKLEFEDNEEFEQTMSKICMKIIHFFRGSV